MQIGDKVYRKGRSLQWGILRRLITVRTPFGAQATTPTHAEVDWHAPRRIGGRGFHRSMLKIEGIVLATDEEREKRRIWLAEHR